MKNNYLYINAKNVLSSFFFWSNKPQLNGNQSHQSYLPIFLKFNLTFSTMKRKSCAVPSKMGQNDWWAIIRYIIHSPCGICVANESGTCVFSCTIWLDGYIYKATKSHWVSRKYKPGGNVFKSSGDDLMHLVRNY